MDKFAAIKAFVRVVEAGTFTKAADSLDVPKAQISRLVQSLEAELTTLLLSRTTRRVTVTADGAAYYEHAVRLLAEMSELETSLSCAKRMAAGKLRIGVPASVANVVLIPAMEDFCARYPDIRIEIGIGDRPVDLVDERFDCVLRIGQIAEQSLVARRMADIDRVVCASPGYLARRGIPHDPADLDGIRHHVIMPFARCNDAPFVLRRADESHEVQARPVLAANDADALLSAALAGLGVVRTEAFMAAPHVATGALRLILPEWSVAKVPLYLAYLPNRYISARLRLFIDWAVELFPRALQQAPQRQHQTAAPRIHERLAIAA